MNVLILSCNTGGGHNAAARAVAEVFRAHGDEARIGPVNLTDSRLRLQCPLE